MAKYNRKMKPEMDIELDEINGDALYNSDDMKDLMDTLLGTDDQDIVVVKHKSGEEAED